MHRQNFWMSLGPFGVRMNRQFAKQPPERLVLIQRQFLISEEQNLVRHQRIVHFLELLIAKRTRQIDARYFRTDRGGGRSDRNRLVGHDTRPLLAASGAACPFSARRANRWSDVEAEQQHIAVLDDVFLALNAQLAGLARARLADASDVIV